jgi:hypothetical protein
MLTLLIFLGICLILFILFWLIAYNFIRNIFRGDKTLLIITVFTLGFIVNMIITLILINYSILFAV